MAMPRRSDVDDYYDRDLPVDLLTLLMKARLDEYDATGAAW
jgi:hypothetical protein